jgi:hypothetical protein
MRLGVVAGKWTGVDRVDLVDGVERTGDAGYRMGRLCDRSNPALGARSERMADGRWRSEVGMSSGDHF